METHTIKAVLLLPIGVVKVIWRIAGKVVAPALRDDIIKYTGTPQVYARQEAGIEAAIHSMNIMYGDKNIWLLSQTKTWLEMQLRGSEKTEFAFLGTKIKIITEGHRCLEAAVSIQLFKDLYVTIKVSEWISKSELVSKIGPIEPQSTYCAFTASLKFKATSTMSTISDIC